MSKFLEQWCMMLKARLFIVSLIFFLSEVNAFASDKLVFVIDIIRHGDRTPLIEIPKAPHHWQEGPGQLTPKGMSQEYELGKNLRKKYIFQYHLLPKHYSAKTMYVRATEYERTVMSAQSFLLGLYPPGTGPTKPEEKTYVLPNGYQPIAIFTQPRQEDSLLGLFNNKPLFGKLLQKYVYSTSEWIKKEQEVKQNMVAWSEKTGFPLIEAPQLIELADAIYIHQLYNIPLPSGLSQDDIKTIRDTVHWQWATFYKSPYITSVAGSALLKTIVEQLQKASQTQTELKYILFFAHDNTLLTQMAILGAPLDTWPEYASVLNFSLFEKGNQNFSVKVSYNNKPVFIPACRGFSCNLKDLVRLEHAIEDLSKGVLEPMSPE